MGTKLLLALFFVGAVTGNHIQRDPHMCDAEGASSEECNNILPDGTNDIINRPHKMADVASVTVRFYLYKDPQNPNNGREIFIDSPDSVIAANPYKRVSNRTEWKILIPGFPLNGKSPFPQNVIHAYMQRMENVPEERYNVLVVDWSPGPCVYDTRFENTTYTGVVGEKVAEMLLFLDEHGFLSLRYDAHVIGFSAGAHVAGEASRFIFRKFNKKNLLYRITALDPAGEKFWPKGLFENIARPTPWERVPRIRRSFVGFLDVIHTSKEYGIARNIGDIDFFPNGGESQPACRVSLFDGNRIHDFKELCSHVFATELFANSVNNKLMLGCTGCDYYDQYQKNNCPCEDNPILGEFVDDDSIDGYPRASGKAWLNTGDLQNFPNRFRKTLEDAGEPKDNHRRWNQLCN